MHDEIKEEIKEAQQWLKHGINDAQGRDHVRKLIMIAMVLIIELNAEKELRAIR